MFTLPTHPMPNLHAAELSICLLVSRGLLIRGGDVLDATSQVDTATFCLSTYQSFNLHALHVSLHLLSTVYRVADQRRGMCWKPHLKLTLVYFL